MQRYLCNECRRYSKIEMQATVAPTFKLPAKEIASLEQHDRFVITCAQNNTPVQHKFWKAVKRLAAERGAKLLVVPVRYRNPTSPKEKKKAEQSEWWPGEVEEYLVENEVKLHPYLRLLGDVRVAATAVNPLSGLEALSGPASGIVAHGQIAMQTIPTPQSELPKMMHTTGSVSAKNYSETKTGKKGDFHHSLGALVVEKENGHFHMRVVNGDHQDSFYDLNERFTEKGVSQAKRIPAIVVADEHTRFLDPEVSAATYTDKDSLVRQLRPRMIVRHDVLDCYAISHWHRRDTLTRYAKWLSGYDHLEAELEQVIDHINSTTPRDTQNVIVASNHHDHLRRWLNEGEPKIEPWNAKLYHELMYRMLAATEMTKRGAESPDPFELWARDRLSVPARFLRREEPLMIEGVLVSLHGDAGLNGARGNFRSMSKIGAKTIIAHSHTPGICQGCYQVGTSSYLRLGYSGNGPSSWHHCHCLILPNGKRQLVSVIDGQFRG